MRSLVLTVRRMLRTWLVKVRTGGLGAGRPRRWVGAALVVVLVLTLAPASTYSGGSGWGNPLSGVASWLGGIRDLVSGHGDAPVRHGVLRPGLAWSPPGRSADGAQATVRPPGRRVKELTGRRTATTSVFQLDDGRLQAEVSAVPVYWRDASGRWRDIDTRIVAAGSSSDGFVFGNDTAGFSTRFGKRSDALVRVRLGQRWVRVGVAGPRRALTPVVKGSSVRYAGVWPGVDVVYELTASGVKESIVLTGRPTGSPSFAFTVTTAGLDTRVLADGSVGFFTTGGGGSAGAVFSIPKPFMLDARAQTGARPAPAYSDAVEMALAGTGTARTVTITPDPGWLAAADRVFPVVVDPTVVVQPDTITSDDVMVASDAPDANFYSRPALGVGVQQRAVLRSLVRFNLLSSVVPSGTTVDTAALSLYWDNAVLEGTGTTSVPVEARAVTRSWNSESVTWNTVSSAVGDLAGSATFNPAQTNTWTDVPVTGVVRDWLAGTRPNNGLVVKAVDETTARGGPYYTAGDSTVLPVGAWPTTTTRTAPKLTLTFGLPDVVIDDPQIVRSTGAQLSWSAYPSGSGSADDPVEVQVHRSTAATFTPAAATLLATLPGGATSPRAYTDTTAPPDTVVSYRVAVRRADGQVAVSQAKPVRTPPAGYVDASLPPAADTTLSACQPTTALDAPGGRPALAVGTFAGAGPVPALGVSRSVLKWDLSTLPASARVTQAQARLWRTLSPGGAASFAAYALTRDFTEASATWRQAAAGVAWTTAGGDTAATPAGQVALPAQTSSDWADIDVTGQVQAWQTTPSSNHGLLWRAVTEPASACATNGAGMLALSSEGAETSARPRLHIRYVDQAETYASVATPPTLQPGETVTVPVTVTNSSTQTWPAGTLQLCYWWKRPDGTDATTAGSQLFTNLPSPLAPGQVVTFNAQLKAPALSSNGNKAEQFTLRWDLFDAQTGTWKSSSAQVPQLPQQIRVEDPTSDQLGLEKFYAYRGAGTGAGSTAKVNLYSGNLAWSYNALANPSRGPRTFVRMTYNSLDTSAAAMGFGWSLQTSTIQRLGSQLSFHPPGQKFPSQVRMVDGDGTTHVWQLNTHGLQAQDCTPTTCDYTHPRGVHLYLQQTGSADPTRTWVFTRPDRTQFFFDDEGFQTAIVDNNGNTMSFVYERRRSANKPTKFLQRIDDATDRHTLTLTYYAKGDPYTYIDDTTGQQVTDTNLTNPFIIDQVKSLTDISGRRITFTYTAKGLMAKMVDGDGSATPKVFRFTYDATQGNNNVKLVQVTDPRGATESGRHTTDFAYYSRPEDDPKFKWYAKSITDRTNGVTSFAYTDPDGPQGARINTTVTDAENHTTTYQMDEFGRPTQVTDAKNQTTKLHYDADHNVDQLQEPALEGQANGAIWTWEYDPKTGYPLTITDAEAVANGTPGTTLDYAFTLNGFAADVRFKTSPEGRKWEFGYDAKGNLKTVTDPKGTATTTVPGDFTTSYDYDQVGNLIQVTDANSHALKYGQFDANGYPQTIEDAAHNTTTFKYDERGQVFQVEDALHHHTTQAYDTFGRPGENRVPIDEAQGRFAITPAPEYDPNDNVTAVTAANGAVVQATYDEADRLQFTLDPLDHVGDPQRRTSYTYDKVGNLRTTTEPNGNLTPSDPTDFVTTNNYDAIYQLTSVVANDRPNGTTDRLLTASFEYDHVGNVKTVIDPRKNATADTTDVTYRYDYDKAHRPTKQTDAELFFTTTTYDKDGLVVKTTDEQNVTTEIDRDERGMPKEVRVPHDNGSPPRTTRYEYDPVGNQTKVISPRGVETTNDLNDFVAETVYDELNRVKETRTPFDKDDPRITTADITTYHYDPLSRLDLQSAPPSAGQTVRIDTRYTYFDNGWNRTSTDPFGIVTSYDYDQVGNQTLRRLTPAGQDPTDPSSTTDRTITWQYFVDGKLASLTDDGVGTPTVLVDNSDTHNVTAAGNWPTSTAATNKFGPDFATHAAGTGANRFTWKLNVPQTGSYQVFARFPTVSGAATNATYTVNHAAGSTVATVNQTQQAGTWVSLGTFAFTEGNTHSVSLSDQAGGTVIADAVKLVRSDTGQAHPGTHDFTYTYDPNGNLKKIADASTDALVDEYAIGYDGVNQVKQVQEKLDGVVKNATTYSYNENGLPETVTHDKQFSRYFYGTRDLVSSVRVGAFNGDPNTKITSYGYTGRKQINTETKANGNVVSYDYFFDQLLKTQTEKRSDGTTLVSDHTMAYDANGNMTRDVAKTMNADNHVTYLTTTSNNVYDPRDRIVTKTATGDGAGTETYVHDANDNVTEQAINGTTTVFGYDRNRLVTSSTAGATSTFNYDPFGRLDTVTAGNTIAERNVYDGFDHIIENRKTGGGTTATTRYTFDPLDRTTSETTNVGKPNQKITNFTYLGLSSEVLDEEDVAGKVSKSYQYSPWGERLSQTIHNDDGSTEDAFYGYNPHTDVDQVTDSTGDTKATYGYTAYGNDETDLFTGIDKPGAADPTKEPFNVYRYNAKRFDRSSGTYDMGFRDYNPGLNRFLVRDTYNGALSDLNLSLDPFSGNRYAFGGGNPTSMIELDGHDPHGCAPTDDAAAAACHERGRQAYYAENFGLRKINNPSLGVPAQEYHDYPEKVDNAAAFIFGWGLNILGEYIEGQPGPARGNFTVVLTEVEVETSYGPTPRVVAFVSQGGIPDKLNKQLEAAGITVYQAAPAPKGSTEGHAESAAAALRANIGQQIKDLGGRIVNVRSAFSTSRICGADCRDNLNKFINDPSKSVREGTNGMIEGEAIDDSLLRKVRGALGLRGQNATKVTFRGFWQGMIGIGRPGTRGSRGGGGFRIGDEEH
jgi:RHS repeat-associated protein